jgi:hypothetical protein
MGHVLIDEDPNFPILVTMSFDGTYYMQIMPSHNKERHDS